MDQSSLNYFQLWPWVGGTNTTLDPSTVPSNQLIQAYNLIFGVQGSRKKREGINFDWDDASNGSESIIAGLDFWFGSTTKTQRELVVTSGKKVYSYNGGTRSADLFAGSAWASSISTACITPFTNLAIISVDGSGNIMKKWDGTTFANLGGTPPVASITREHLGRLWCNDKTNCDRLHYSTTANAEEWNGAGDSGALDIGTGDGDPDGITGIFPTFEGVLFVAKRTKLYKVLGDTPESFQVVKVSDSLGCSSHNSIAAIDKSDVFWQSAKGIHSLSTTDTYGDFKDSYVSVDIQRTVNEEWSKSRFKHSSAGYLAHINSYAIAVTDETFSTGANNAIWLYNIPLKSWYVWPNLSCQALWVADDSDKRRFYLGTNTTRVAKTFTGTNYDVSTSGSNAAIVMRIKTGFITVDENPLTDKAFYQFKLIFKKIGTFQVTVSVKVDTQDTQALSYSGVGGDLVGSTFTMGQSLLGASGIVAPYSQLIDGIGRRVQITIEQSGTDQEIEIYGFALGFIQAGISQEVI